jgi:hypothetical protein
MDIIHPSINTHRETEGKKRTQHVPCCALRCPTERDKDDDNGSDAGDTTTKALIVVLQLLLAKATIAAV